jgi:hypothetical protein
MSWRFRKTFKLLPGVKLNLTAHGLSATLGAAPFSINVGPRGVYRNLSIPGTGIWDRQRIGSPSSQPSGIQPPTTDYDGGPRIPPLPPSILVSLSTATEIHSASTELLTSESLEQLRRLLTDAYNERDELTKEISSATLESNTAARRYQTWERGFLMKRIFRQAFAARREGADTAVAKLAELQEQLRLTVLATEITIDREQAEPYYRMRDAVAALSECRKTWNVLAAKTIDRIVERSTASTAITRDPVSFSLNSCDLIQWKQKVPYLPNRTGGDMYIYPGFILFRASQQAFALIDFRDVKLTFISTQFTEDEAVPSDTQIVGHTWAKSNKDGTPDRRFANNYRIPVVGYGSLLFSSSDGLDVRYLCSNARLAEQFAKAWSAFRMSFNSDFRQQRSDDIPTGKQPKESLMGVEKWNQAFERSTAAFESFTVTQDKLNNAIATVAQGRETDPTFKGMMSDEDFTTYIAAVAELTAADKELEEHSQLLSRSARGNFRRAIQGIETSMATFVASVSDGRINAEKLTPFFDAIIAFRKARIDFFDANIAAFEKHRAED